MNNELINVTNNIEELINRYETLITDVKLRKESTRILLNLLIIELLELDSNISKIVLNVINTRTLEKPFFAVKSALNVEDNKTKQRINYYKMLIDKNDTNNIEKMFSPLLYKALIKKVGEDTIIDYNVVQDILLPEVLKVNDNISNYFNRQNLITNIINIFVFQQTWYKITNLYNINFFDENFDEIFNDEYIKTKDFVLQFYNLQDNKSA